MHPQPSSPRPQSSRRVPLRLLRRLVLLRPGEGTALLWAAAYFYCLLFGYYLLRPLRDELGIRGDLEDLPWLWTGTTIAMLVAVPAFGALVSRFPRRVFVPVTYHFFTLNVLVFWALLGVLPLDPGARLWVGYAFYIWLSVFNLFAVSVFWGFMADLFTNEQSKRLFGAIGVGGTLGAICGSAVPATLVGGIDVGPVSVSMAPSSLLLLTAVMLELAVLCVRRLVRIFGIGDLRTGAPPAPSRCPSCDCDLDGLSFHSSRDRCPECGQSVFQRRGQEPGRGMWQGVVLVVRSPYLQLIAAYMLLYTMTSTFLYFEQARIVKENFSDSAGRTAVFARIDLAVNVLTLLTQLFLTGRLLTYVGVGVGLSLLPALTVAGFAALLGAPAAGIPVVGVLLGFQIVRRSMHYAVDRPTREVLFTVLGPDAKYKSKSFIDTFVYRGGDLLGAWTYSWLAAIGSLAIPVAAAWLAVAAALAARQRRMASENGDTPPPVQADTAPAAKIG